MTSVSQLEQLRSCGTVIVCDTGDLESITRYDPQDCTTNPSLILSATQNPKYADLVEKAVRYGKDVGRDQQEKTEIALDAVFVEIGCKILDLVPGRVSTEVDARLSFNKDETIRRALRIVKLYEERGFSKERVLIKIASTWEGIQAAKELESVHGIHCNLTLLFSFVQAVACAEANVTLISPFLGRIMDFYKEKKGSEFSPEDDPGIKTVKDIYYYYKTFGYKTIVMGTCFRNNNELLAVAGIDSVTLPPKQLEEWKTTFGPVKRRLFPEDTQLKPMEKISYISDQAKFRFDMNENEMAVEKLSDGIRRFSVDNANLQKIIEEKLESIV